VARASRPAASAVKPTFLSFHLNLKPPEIAQKCTRSRASRPIHADKQNNEVIGVHRWPKFDFSKLQRRAFPGFHAQERTKRTGEAENSPQGIPCYEILILPAKLRTWPVPFRALMLG
jgi:hypothetical protein